MCAYLCVWMFSFHGLFSAVCIAQRAEEPLSADAHFHWLTRYARSSETPTKKKNEETATKQRATGGEKQPKSGMRKCLVQDEEVTIRKYRMRRDFHRGMADVPASYSPHPHDPPLGS